MKNETMKECIPLSFKEELGNTISHAIPFFLLLFSLPYYAIQAYLKGGARLATGISVYSFCMMFMFGFSALYHMMPYHTMYKYVLRKLDHIMIFLAIAGTYTPICLYALNDTLSCIVLGIEWLMVFLGVLLKSIAKKRYKKLSLAIYLVMGWMALVIMPDLIGHVQPVFLMLIVAGGVFYSIGIYFYLHPEKEYFHFIWHLFIILASLCHFIAIMYFM